MITRKFLKHNGDSDVTVVVLCLVGMIISGMIGIYPGVVFNTFALAFFCAHWVYHAWIRYSRIRGEVQLLETITAWRRCIELGVPFASEMAQLAYDGKSTVTRMPTPYKMLSYNVDLHKTAPEKYAHRFQTKDFTPDRYADAREWKELGNCATIRFTSGKALSIWKAMYGTHIFEYDGTFAVCTPIGYHN